MCTKTKKKEEEEETRASEYACTTTGGYSLKSARRWSSLSEVAFGASVSLGEWPSANFLTQRFQRYAPCVFAAPERSIEAMEKRLVLVSSVSQFRGSSFELFESIQCVRMTATMSPNRSPVSLSQGF